MDLKSNRTLVVKDILLYPKSVFAKLSDKKPFLIFGIILVGLIDIFLPDLPYVFGNLFTGKEASDLKFNIILAVLSVVAIGALDVLFFSLPLHDLIKFLKKREGGEYAASRIKTMKVYILSHFLIVPVNLAVYYLFIRNINANSTILEAYAALGFYFLMLVWGSAIVARGLTELFKSGLMLSKLTFSAILIWNLMIGAAFDYQLLVWIGKLFK